MLQIAEITECTKINDCNPTQLEKEKPQVAIKE